MVYIVAEIGINHNGSLDVAKKLIDIAADAGCDAVKFQKRTVDLVYSQEELAKPRESPWGNTFGDQKRGLEFDRVDYEIIDTYCRSRSIQWFASPWDVESVKFLGDFDIPYIKVPSALLTNVELAAEIHKSQFPVMISTGMSTVQEITNAVEEYGRYGLLDTIMHCTSTYPTAPSEMNLDVVGRMTRERLIVDDDITCHIPARTRVGFSNHYSGIVWAPAVVALGAEVIEFHVTLDRTMYGSDQAASIEPDGVRRIVEHVRLTERMLGDGVKRVYDSELPILQKLRR